MTVIAFPIDRMLGALPALGGKMGVRVQGKVLVWESAVRAPDGELYVRVAKEGYPTKHYRGDLSLGVAADRYVQEVGAVEAQEG